MLKFQTASTTEAADNRAVPYYVKGLALGVTAYLIGIHLWTWIFMLPTFLGGRADFRQLYTAGYMLRSGSAMHLYDYDAQLYFQRLVVGPGEIPLPFIRPAFEALLFAPFSLLPYRSAYFLFLMVNISLLSICFRLLRVRLGNIYEVYPWLPVAMFLAFLPIAAALMQGQDSILLLTLLTVSLVLLDRSKDFVAGLLVGLGLFKLQIVIPIGVLFIVWRRWRFSSGFSIASVAMALLSIEVAGYAQARGYALSLLSIGSGPWTLGRYPVPVQQMANLHGLIFGLTSTRMSESLVRVVTVVLSALLLGVSAVRARRTERSDSLLLAICVSAVVSYYLLIHDLSVLFLPIVLTLNRHLPSEATADKEGRVIARAAALLFVAPMLFSYAPDHFYLVSLPMLALLFALLRAAGTKIKYSQTNDGTIVQT